MHKLSTKSKEQFNTLHPDLKLVIEEALKHSSIDFGITEGHRTPETQFEYFKKGRKLVDDKWVISDVSKVITYVDGFKVKGKHNHSPSLAFDFFASVPGKNLSYDTNHLIALGSTFVTIGNMLYERGDILRKVRWGGNFDRDGEILESGTFIDSPHIELEDA